MKRPFYTRKNLILLAICMFYAIVVFYTGICVDGGHSLISKRNIIFKLFQELNFKEIDAALAGFVGLILLAVYIILFSAGVLYIRRYLIENGKSPIGSSAWVAYGVLLLVCVVLSIGLTILFVSPKTSANIGNTLLYLGANSYLMKLLFHLHYKFGLL